LGQTRLLRNGFLAGLYFLSALWGARLIVSPPDPLLDLMFTGVVAVAVVVTCIYDSRLSGKPIVQSLHWLMLFTWPIAAPVYLVWSRGRRGAMLAAMHAVLLYMTLLVSYYGNAVLIYGAGG
jgi:hypothetical protein